jgi:hypothetical protein
MGKPTFDPCYSEDGERAHRLSYCSCGMHGLRTNRDHEKVFVPEYIGYKSKPGELKHLSTRRKGHQRDSVSSGERTRTRPVLLFV